MIILLLVFFTLSLFTYMVVKRSVAKITRTPIWLLWAVMMAPAFIWMAWLVVNGENEQMPFALFIIPFVVCPMLYWFLVQWGRLPEAPKPSRTADDLPTSDGLLTYSSSLEGKSTVRPVNQEEEKQLRNCFSWSVYYLQTVEYRPQAVICRGQLRTSPEVAYKTIRENIEAQFGDRFLIIFQEGMQGKPFFALVVNPAANSNEDASPVSRPLLALGLLVATLLTTTLAGAWLMIPPGSEFTPEASMLWSGLPYALSIMAILGTHELAHYLAARRYRIQATYPYFIPVPPALIFPFGTFGAFIQMRSPVPHRKALFDVGIAGPLAGFVMTIPLLIWGLAHSETLPLEETSSLFTFDSFSPTSSLLLTLLARLSLGSAFTADQALSLHPVAIAGCLGLIVTALNLMPVGQLDGGHIVHAMFGQRTGALIGQVARFLVLALAFVQSSYLVWAILLFLMPTVDQPALNDVTELNDSRDFLGLLALGLLVIIVLPAPPLLLDMLLAG
ncbi:site-2 protease family protein [Leptolyngbya sp. CCY15150]|uniref:site-2 protease family protein n=1 Tax=Leptolyngbya sp. CCY15150 TaxID=2767772 RepID=UPI00194F2CB8|nr:site-2 protease family protein [Leptolyngbya sp. CCY15150]